MRESFTRPAHGFLLRFLRDRAVEFDMVSEFRTFVRRVISIQQGLRRMIKVRNFRLVILNRMFEREKNIMMNYYQEKGKKLKKLKQEQQKLALITQADRDRVLSVYFHQIVASNNYVKGIIWNAQDQFEFGDRLKAMLNDEEHRHIVNLKRNIKSAEEYLFHGLKHNSVFESKEEDHQFQEVNLADYRGLPAVRKSSEESIAESESPWKDGTPTLSTKTQALGLPTSPKREKKLSTFAKALESPEKSQDQKPRPSIQKPLSKLDQIQHNIKKQVKKKKAKGIEEVPWKLPSERPAASGFTVERLTMQKMVLKAANSKEGKTEPPKFIKVFPWIKVINKDLYS